MNANFREANPRVDDISMASAKDHQLRRGIEAAKHRPRVKSRFHVETVQISGHYVSKITSVHHRAELCEDAVCMFSSLKPDG
jgi:hypothetical protein